jgi:prolyl oligopeptidase
MLTLLSFRKQGSRMARNRNLVAWTAGLLALEGLAIAFTSCCEPQIAGGSHARQWNYPRAARGAVVDDYFGTKVADPYRWMENLDAPDTKAWEIAETRLWSQFIGGQPRRAQFRDRIASLWNFPSYGPAWKEGGQYFFTSNDGTQDQDVLYVQAGPGAAPRVLLDPNALSSDGTVALTASAVSPDGRWLAYGTSKAGSSWKQVHVLAVATGQVGADLVPWVRYSRLAWTRDSAGFFYSCYPEPAVEIDEAKDARPIANHRIYYHRVGTPQSDDRLIYRPEQPGWMADAAVTADGRYVVINVASQVAGDNLVRFIALGDPAAPDLGAPVRPLIDAWNAQYSVIGNDGPIFYVQTNQDAPRGRIVAIDTGAPAPANWRTVVPESPDALQSSSIVGGKLVVLALHNVASRLRVYERDGTPLPEVALPSPMGTVGAISGHPDDPELLFSFTTFTSPTTTYRLDLETRENRAFQQPTVGFNPAAFETAQVFYTSKDGTRVPLFVTRKKGMRLDGTAPTLLYGYGGFDVSLTPSFYVPAITWMEMGGVYAVANLRGGGEFGEDWHQAGMRQNKQNVFDDFIAAAQWLFANGYTSPAHLAIRGRSNGGLLIGATLNQRPDLCRVAFPEVGVMDMLRFQKFPNGRFWVSDYGSSDDRDGFRTLGAYSPLHTIRTGARYPAVCVIAADSDDKVNPAHSLKYTAALQAAADDGPWALPVFIRIESQAGHGRGLARSKVIDTEADKLAFAAYFLGL